MTIITKPILDKKDEKAFLADFEGPPNVAVTIPCDAAPPLVTGRDSEDENSQDEADTVRIHNRMGGFKFVFLAILIVAALTSGFCFYRALHVAQYRRGFCALPLDLRYFDDTTLISGRFTKDIRNHEKTPDEMLESLVTEVKERVNEKLVEEDNGQLGLEYEIDVETETFELTQMPQLSRGKYLHDFKMNKTLIIDTDNNRCFIMALNRNEIAPPRDFMEFINRLNNGVYQLDLDEVRHETRVVTPPLDHVDSRVFGIHVASNCRDRTSYLLEDLEKVLVKRGADEEKKFQFVEFSGKHFIKYNIVNINEI